MWEGNLLSSLRNGRRHSQPQIVLSPTCNLSILKFNLEDCMVNQVLKCHWNYPSRTRAMLHKQLHKNTCIEIYRYLWSHDNLHRSRSGFVIGGRTKTMRWLNCSKQQYMSPQVSGFCLLMEEKGAQCSSLLQLLCPKTSPVQPLEPSPVPRDPGSLPRLGHAASISPFQVEQDSKLNTRPRDTDTQGTDKTGGTGCPQQHLQDSCKRGTENWGPFPPLQLMEWEVHCYRQTRSTL